MVKTDLPAQAWIPQTKIMKAKIKFQVAKQVGPQQMINISAINHVTRQLYDIYIIYIYFASQKYTVVIRKDLP